MASKATIGALRVVLGADTAAFSRDLKGAQSQLGNFAAAAKRAGPIIATALAAAAVGLGVAIKGVIDKADELAKTSQKIGVPVEELSRLTHAADLSGSSFEQLTKGVEKFNKNIVGAAQGSSAPLQAFAALDLQFKRTDGSLRNVNELLPEIADRFASMPDGPEKTAIAMDLFGRAGAQLIPMLNAGSAGLDKMKAEADQLGIVIDTKAAMAAERFNDNLDRLQKTFGSVVYFIVNNVTETLANFSDQVIEISQKIGAGIEYLKSLFGDDEDGTVLQIVHPETPALINEAAASTENFKVNLDAYKQSQDAAKASTDATNLSIQQGQAVFDQTRTAAEAYAIRLQELAALHNAGHISADTYARAQAQAAENANNTWSQAAMGISGSFAEISDSFAGESREMATVAKIAGVIQSTIAMYQGMAEALKLPFPANFVAMAAVAAQGASLVASIQSQKVPAFAEGGSFRVGGAGAIDSKMVSMRVSPGEMVDVKKKGQSGGMGMVDVRVIVDESGNIVPVIERVSENVSARVVRDSAPGLVRESQRASLSAIGSGKGDSALGSRFQVRPAPKER